MGLHPGDGAFAVQPTLRADRNRVRVSFDRQLALGDIRYTTDGSAPTAASPRYQAPLDLAMPARVRAASLLGPQSLATPVDLPLDRVTASRRASQQLQLCSDGVPLNLPGKAAAAGAPGPAYYLDIRNPCWIYRDADLSGARHVAVRVAALPFNFQFGAEPPQALPPTATPAGELTVRRGCDGPVLATVPLVGVRRDGTEQELVAALPAGPARDDLCVALARPTLSPLWALAGVELRP
jgi:hexosaminidase